MLKNIHALLIDDDLFNLEVLNRFLSHEGITCTCAQDIKRVRSVIASAPQIDLIFLDLEMPHINGYEVFALLRSVFGDEIPIIACTVHLNEMVSVRQQGFDGFISKPLDQRRFPDQVRRILRGEQVWEV